MPKWEYKLYVFNPSGKCLLKRARNDQIEFKLKGNESLFDYIFDDLENGWELFLADGDRFFLRKVI